MRFLHASSSETLNKLYMTKSSIYLIQEIKFNQKQWNLPSSGVVVYFYNLDLSKQVLE